MKIVSEQAERLLHLEFEAHADNLKAIRPQVDETAVAEGFDEKTADQLVLAIDEACANVIRHAYEHKPGPVVLNIYREGDQLVFVLRDFAESIDCSTIKPRSLDEVRPGGLGINLIDQIMDNWEFANSSDGSGNLLIMKKQLPHKKHTAHVQI